MISHSSDDSESSTSLPGASNNSSDDFFGGFNGSVTLNGSHFHDPESMASLIISGICVFSFVGIMIWYAWVKGKNKRTKKLLHWATIGVSIFFVILYFGLDLIDRILHELEVKVSPLYFRISIPLETFTLFGDLMLLTFLLLYLSDLLLDHAGISSQHSSFLRLAHKVALALLLILFIADRISFIYKSITDAFLTPVDIYALSSTDSQLGMIAGAYTKLNTAFYGLYLGCALSFGTTSAMVLHRLRKAHVLHRTFSVFLPLLSIALLIRTAVNLTYAVYFKLMSKPQTLTDQLIRVLFYGLLSIAIYVSALKISATEDDWESIVDSDSARGGVEYGLVNGSGTNASTLDWRPQQQYQYPMLQQEPQKMGTVSILESETNYSRRYTPVPSQAVLAGGGGAGFGQEGGYGYRPRYVQEQ